MDKETEIYLSQLEWHKAQVESDAPGVMEPIWRVKIGKWQPGLIKQMMDALEEVGTAPQVVYSHTLEQDTIRITGQENIDRLEDWHKAHEEEFRALANRIHQAEVETTPYDHLWAPSRILAPDGSTEQINMRVTIKDEQEAIRLHDNLIVLKIPPSAVVFEDAGEQGYKVRVLEEGLQTFHEMLESRQHYLHRIIPGIARSPIPDRQTLAQTDAVAVHTQATPGGGTQVRADVASGGWLMAKGTRQNDLPVPFEETPAPSGMGRRYAASSDPNVVPSR